MWPAYHFLCFFFVTSYQHTCCILKLFHLLQSVITLQETETQESFKSHCINIGVFQTKMLTATWTLYCAAIFLLCYNKIIFKHYVYHPDVFAISIKVQNHTSQTQQSLIIFIKEL